MVLAGEGHIFYSNEDKIRGKVAMIQFSLKYLKPGH
jgi:hypothetical protein